MIPKNPTINSALLFSGALLILMSFTPLNASPLTSTNSKDGLLRVNPDFKITRMSNGDVIVTLKNQDGDALNHKFTDFYADLLLAAYRKQRMEIIVDNLSKKFYLSEDECRREIKHAINVLTEWHILLRNDQIAMQ